MFRALIAQSVMEALHFLTESDTCDTCSLSSSVAKTPRSGQNLSIKRLETLNESMTTQKLGQRIGNQCSQAACACGLAIRESKRTLGTMAPYPGMIDNKQARAENLTFQEWEPQGWDGLG